MRIAILLLKHSRGKLVQSKGRGKPVSLKVKKVIIARQTNITTIPSPNTSLSGGLSNQIFTELNVAVKVQAQSEIKSYKTNENMEH